MDPYAGMADGEPRARSFRDPAGRLVFIDRRPLRFVRRGWTRELRAFLESDVAARYRARGALVDARELSTEEITELVARHPGVALDGDWESVMEPELIPFASYAGEWAPSMLHAAARVTLELARDVLELGRGLKDATPGNILFRGTNPVFVDLLSVEPRDAADPVWRPYGQYVSAFLIPLLLYRHTTLTPRMVFAGGREGVDPEQASGLLPVMARVRFPGRSLVAMPVALAPVAERMGEELYEPRRTTPDNAAFTLRRMFDRLERMLSALEPSVRRSRWSGYVETTHSAAYHEQKRDLLTAILTRLHPNRVLDVGCNTGVYSTIAADAGASVVAIDSDVAALEQCVSAGRERRRDILPLVVDIAAPTAGAGWRNGEDLSFLDRARGQFDLVMALAVVHHLVVGARVPLSEVLDLLASLTREWILVEFVEASDAWSRKLARGRSNDGLELSRAEFEAACRVRCSIEQVSEIADSGRVLYLLRLRPNGA